MTDVEDLLRNSLARHAGEAPTGPRLLDGVRERSRRRQRRVRVTGLAAAAVALAAVVTTTVAIVPDRPARAPAPVAEVSTLPVGLVRERAVAGPFEFQLLLTGVVVTEASADAVGFGPPGGGAGARIVVRHTAVPSGSRPRRIGRFLLTDRAGGTLLTGVLADRTPLSIEVAAGAGVPDDVLAVFATAIRLRS